MFLFNLLSGNHANIEKKSVTILGDSTIDNKIWVMRGINGKDTSDLSVIDHLSSMLPGYAVNDYTNDGFTTHDCLYGENKDKVFGQGAFSMFPHEFFSPMKAATKDISHSQYIILSVGGNNIREFLLNAYNIRNVDERQEFIKETFEDVFDKLRDEYLEIVKQLRKLNSSAKIILMTQYYPSFSQHDYNIYQFMHELGYALELGENPDHPADVIHEIMKKTYLKTLQALPSNNVVVADVTSSLDPFDSNNHVHQIEPSGEGGKKIAKILSYIIRNVNHESGVVYRFSPDFFDIKDNEMSKSVNCVEQIRFADWVPVHPDSFVSARTFNQ